MKILERSVNFLKLKKKYGDFRHYSSGKVREVFYDELSDRIVVVTTDRVSAFDERVGSIPDKGKILTGISSFWSLWVDFDSTIPYKTAFLASNAAFYKEGNLYIDIPEGFDEDPKLDGRVTYMVNLDMFPIECIVRGHITGSAWKLYEKGEREICGVKLPDGLKNGDPFPDGPIFTPTTKATSGHDENITFEEMVKIISKNYMGDLDTAETIKKYCLDLYKRAYDFAHDKGLIIADTKFELGLNIDGEIIFGDEILTPDSSRFWDASKFEPGKEQPSFDKQIIRDYIAKNKNEAIPRSVIQKTRQRYIDCYEKLVGQAWPK
ncbi:phosphoribosylaminoimidazolesuccinocarboxamide synthase [Candidatus Saccharibacteria bacterium]|nr:phosphoribosylaminoimidazolesuccinocarboxamide synthase [Candidatus Saccharibacteria bacterium]